MQSQQAVQAEAKQLDCVRSLQQAAEQLGISVWTLKRLHQADKIKIIQLSARRCGVRDSEITRFLNRCEAAA